MFPDIYNMGNFLSNTAKLNLVLMTTFIGFVSILITSGEHFSSFDSILSPLIVRIV